MTQRKAPHSDRRLLPDTFNRHLTAYCVAATTAGVGVLALAQPSEAKVVITNKTIPIHGNVTLDLNNDGVPDFDFSFFQTQAHYFRESALSIVPSHRGGAIVGKQGYASALLRGAKIGPSQHFSGGVNENSLVGVGIEDNGCSYSKCASGGQWSGNNPNRFLGARFAINGTIHYGWVRMTVTVTSGFLEATVTGYGYETAPGKAIVAGVTPSNITSAALTPGDSGMKEKYAETPSLGMLASGVDGLSIWRRQEVDFAR